MIGPRRAAIPSLRLRLRSGTAARRTISYQSKDRKPDDGWGHFKPSPWGQCKPSRRKGQLHPRAVPLYNLLHRFWGPLVLGLVALALSRAWLLGALAWGFHVAIDRALGYGLRTREGFQRG